MSYPTLPLEIRSLIYQNMDDFSLAKEIPEVFWAIVPKFFKRLYLGKRFSTQRVILQTELVDIYPLTARYVEHLIIFPEMNSDVVIKNFLEKNPLFPKLTLLRLCQSPDIYSYTSVSHLGFLEELEKLVEGNKTLTRLSFDDIFPSHSLLQAGFEHLTQVDFAYGFPIELEDNLVLPPNIEILTITPSIVSFINGDSPKLRTLIIKADTTLSSPIRDFIRERVETSPLLKSLGFIDKSAEDSYILLLVNNIPQIENVCFKFLEEDLGTIQDVCEFINEELISFKLCTFLLAGGPYTIEGKTELKGWANDFTRIYNLDSTFVSYRGYHIIPEGGDEQVLKEWLSVM